eukprot:43733-Chlamydomonas_euryale.AAC.2
MDMCVYLVHVLISSQAYEYACVHACVHRWACAHGSLHAFPNCLFPKAEQSHPQTMTKLLRAGLLPLPKAPDKTKAPEAVPLPVSVHPHWLGREEHETIALR